MSAGSHMYYQHNHQYWGGGGGGAGGGVDGYDVSCDAAAMTIFSSRPDTLLANGGGAFLPSPPPSSYMLPPPPLLVARQPPSPSQQTLSSAMAAAATTSRVLSTGDLLCHDRDMEEAEQRVAPPPGRYSAEERRERIDKYRSKRNQRNFQKKITYACRKTLADSRPRVKGRFARNAGDYTEASVPPEPAEWQQEALVATTEDYDLPAGRIVLYGGDDDDDDDMLAAYLGVSSISLCAGSPSASTTDLPHHHGHHYSCHQP